MTLKKRVKLYLILTAIFAVSMVVVIWTIPEDNTLTGQILITEIVAFGLTIMFIEFKKYL